jgi:hypothetical protein
VQAGQEVDLLIESDETNYSVLREQERNGRVKG